MITTLLDADEREMEELFEADMQEQKLALEHPRLYRLLEAYWFCKYRVLYAYCMLFKHKWEDNGFATPDSGCIRMQCRRCGHAEPIHWLY